MRKIPVLIFSLFTLSGCGGAPVYLMTAPGAPLPTGALGFCKAHDTVGRCTNWTSNSETCVNPEGVNANPPTIPCADIRKKAQ